MANCSFQIKKELNGKKLKDATEDQTLPVCWKGSKPFKSIGDVKPFFKPLALAFANPRNVQFQIQPEAYLVVTVSMIERTPSSSGYEIIDETFSSKRLIIICVRCNLFRNTATPA